MYIEKNISLTIQLSPKEAYCGDDIVMKKLKNYENYCISNSLIVKILSIEKKGPRVPIMTDTSGIVQMDVQTRVQCIVFYPGNILACSIKHIEPGKSVYGMHMDHIYTNILDTNENIKLKEIVIVKVVNAAFQQYSSNVMIQAELWKPIPIAYSVFGEITEDTKKYLAASLSSLSSLSSSQVMKETKDESKHPLSFTNKDSKGVENIQDFKPKADKKYSFSMGKIFEIDAPNVLNIDINSFITMAIDFTKQQLEINAYLANLSKS